MAHRKTVQHFHQPGHLHEFTFSTYRRLPLLTNDSWREKLARTLEAAGVECRFQLVAFVFMPEHLHLLTYPTDEKPAFGKYLAQTKQPFSKQIREILENNKSRLLEQLTVQERPGWVAPVGCLQPTGVAVPQEVARACFSGEKSSMNQRRRIVDDQKFVHFITFSVYRRLRLLDLDHPKRMLLGWLNETLEKFSAWCIGFVVMPDHVHALIWSPCSGQLSAFVHSWKRRSSMALRGWYREHSSEYFRQFGGGDRFWQPKYSSFEIYNRRKLEEKLQYIHENPVRAGLVKRAVDWRWSSVRWYMERRSVGVPIRLVE